MTVEKSIIQKVKDEIQIDYQIESTELYDLLYDYRNTQHPDKYLNEELKKKAEEKFKEINNLLGQLSKFIELEKQQRKPSELIPFQKNYEITQIKQSVIWQDEEIGRLNKVIEDKDRKIKQLNEQIDKTRNEEQSKLKNELIESYKPSKKTYLFSGLSMLLIVAYSLISKSDQIFDILKKYSPIDVELLNAIFFVVFILILFSLLKKLYEERFIRKISLKVISPSIIRDFYREIPSAEESRFQFFSEYLVYDFIVQTFTPKNIFVNFIFTKLFPIYTETSFGKLKTIFINHLLEMHLIELRNSENLQNYFRVEKHYF